MLDFAPSPQTPRFAFETHDKVTIGDIAYRPVDASEAGYVFVRLDGEGVAESFSRAEIARLVQLGRVRHEREALLPEHARARLKAPSELLSMLPAQQHLRARAKEGAVLAFLQLEEEGHVNRTDEVVGDMLDTITGRAAKLLKGDSHYDEGERQKRIVAVPNFSARTLRRWVTAYERFGISGLFDGIGKQGNTSRRLCPRTQMILADCVRGYMTTQEKTQAEIYKDVKCAFEKENASRRANGVAELVRPSKETVRQAILALDPYQCDVARKGPEAARRKHAPTGIGLNLTRPLQRVEMDTWKVDLISLLADSGILHFLTDEEKRDLGLTGKKKRWWLTVAMCATTRCILAMRMSRTPSGQATIQTLDMMMQDKGIWSDAVGSLSSWHMRGHTPYIFTDCGSEYVSYDVRVAAEDLGISLAHAPGGLPEMRGRVERVFKTASIQLMPRLTGRTFSNMIERGDYDSKGRAALTADDLCAALTRWVVDIYHRSPHEGLDGETPGNCWDRLTEKYGVAPAADLRRRRMAFGTRMTRVVGEGGITVLGLRYHSEALARLMLRRRKHEVRLRWYGEDLGSIAVEVDGEWFEVPSVMRSFDGVRAQSYLLARRALQARFKHEAVLQESIVLQAITEIEAINANAMRRVGLLVEDWSEERLLREEENLFIGFEIEADREATPKQEADRSYGYDLPTTDSVVYGGVQKKVHQSSANVSVPAQSDEFSGGADRYPLSDDDLDDPDIQIEDK
ncbi:Mu transposase C-terminal domain-containing protein [Poseidonocella sedimentorum]|uniref:Putative transposase n=1 Tax=Poseidonocella sedimentorum TaxID=871652 RepID=A0A1I6EMX1_9RHOB|nr:Mu transposase C-terminal domain-containing protein [Poseidonocella sedimentorum]SFR18868.1 putative transposase [Poseidonocella sedimentorum]